MLIKKGLYQYQAADKAGMSDRTARKYLKSEKLPQEMAKTHDWRTRNDPFGSDWEEIKELLNSNPGLEAKIREAIIISWQKGARLSELVKDSGIDISPQSWWVARKKYERCGFASLLDYRGFNPRRCNFVER